VLLQQSTKLYVVNVGTPSRDPMYQQASPGVAAFRKPSTDAPSVEDTVLTYLDAREAAGSWVKSEDGPGQYDIAMPLASALPLATMSLIYDSNG
jgi:hypothetical protein